MENTLIYGVNPVLEALGAGVVLEVYIAGTRREDVSRMEDLAGRRGVPVKRVAPTFFAAFPKGHQSIAARVRPLKTLTDPGPMLEAARRLGEPPLLVALDSVQDPRNLGAVMRSAAAMGAHGIIIPKRRGAGLGAEAIKTSAGAAWGLPVSVQPNIKYSLDKLKEEGLFVYGAQASGGVAPWKCDFSPPLVLVLGGEESGLRRVIAQRCDRLVTIPLRGVNSLNVSVSAGILLFEILRQRSAGK